VQGRKWREVNRKPRERSRQRGQVERWQRGKQGGAQRARRKWTAIAGQRREPGSALGVLLAAAEGLGLVMSFLPVSLSASSGRSVPAQRARRRRAAPVAVTPPRRALCAGGPRLHTPRGTRAGAGADGTGRADVVASGRLLVQQLLAVRHPAPVREKGPRDARGGGGDLRGRTRARGNRWARASAAVRGACACACACT
jgi:hypothetical protein